MKLNTTLTKVATGAAILATTAVAVSAASAQAVEFGKYKLYNHPDGAKASPYYGLRLDELMDVTNKHDVFTFDFEHEDSEVYLKYDENGIHIYGQIFGGLDIGKEYHSEYSGLWELDFVYDTVTKANGDDDAIATAPGGKYSEGTGKGTISSLETSGPFQDKEFDLVDYSGKHNYTFRFGDQNHDQGHRGHDGISGWGWLNHSGAEGHVASSDHLFTAKKVPEPTSALGLLALGTLFASSNFKSKKKGKDA